MHSIYRHTIYFYGGRCRHGYWRGSRRVHNYKTVTAANASSRRAHTVSHSATYCQLTETTNSLICLLIFLISSLTCQAVASSCCCGYDVATLPMLNCCCRPLLERMERASMYVCVSMLICNMYRNGMTLI